MDCDLQSVNVECRNRRHQSFPQLSEETKPDTGVLEHDPSVSVEGGSENGGAAAVAGDGEREGGVNGESVDAESVLCGKGPEVGEGINIIITIEWGPPSRRHSK